MAAAPGGNKKGERKAHEEKSLIAQVYTAKDDLGMGKPSLDLITGGALNFSHFFCIVLIQSSQMLSGNDDLHKSA